MPYIPEAFCTINFIFFFFLDFRIFFRILHSGGRLGSSEQKTPFFLGDGRGGDEVTHTANEMHREKCLFAAMCIFLFLFAKNKGKGPALSCYTTPSSENRTQKKTPKSTKKRKMRKITEEEYGIVKKKPAFLSQLLQYFNPNTRNKRKHNKF